MTEILDLLMKEGRDLQKLLGGPYKDKRMLRGFLARVCEREHFKQLLSSESHNNDPEEFPSRLHFCIDDMQRRTNHALKLPLSEPLSVNYAYNEDNVDIDELEEAEYCVYYKKNHQRFQLRQIPLNRSLPPRHNRNHATRSRELLGISHDR